MTTINYQFADGHYEEIEVTEEFKHEYEFLLVQERAQHWKEMQQKHRAGLRCAKDFSLEKCIEDGMDFPLNTINALESLIEKEEQQEKYEKMMNLLTEKQRQVFFLRYVEGYTKAKIAAMLHIDEKAVRVRLINGQKRLKKFFPTNF